MFRVGDIVERIETNNEGQLVGNQYTVKKVNSSSTHITIDESGLLYYVGNYKLIKPVWKVGDRAKIIDSYDSSRVGGTFVVSSIDQYFVYDLSSAWSFQNVERVAMALDPNPAYHGPVKNDGPTVEDLVKAGFLPELKTTVHREMKVPTYLYDVVDFEPRLKREFADQIKMDETWSVNVWRDGHRVRIENVDVIGFNAERLRKLAKLCTDLADLMG